jgi:hypothetical protein
MIYGLIPVGGKGLRLSLPFSKEMLPQKGYDYYNPILNHLVEKMKKSGAQYIYFVHGKSYKKDIINYYSGKEYIHITQNKLGFSRVLKTFFNKIKNQKNDYKIIFGLPDVYFEGNPFPLLLKKSGLVCGLFKTNKTTKVDRLIYKNKKFDVKSIKNKNNSNYFWGVLKFDKIDFKNLIKQIDFDEVNEIGDILNKYDKKEFCFLGKYIDLGTWSNLNIYWGKKVCFKF